MASTIGDEHDVFESLSKSVDPAVQSEQEKVMNERVRAQYAAAQQRLMNLIDSNTTLPTTINTIRLIGAHRTRKSFLDTLFDPILAVNRDEPYTLQEALNAVGTAADKLRRFGIYHDNISLFVDRPDKSDPNTTTNDIDVWLSVKERGRWSIKTGTNLGNTEGEAYGNFFLRNIFGGAESLSVNASMGTRTRSAYSAILSAPVQSDPDRIASVYGIASSIQKPWASHEEISTGAGIKYNWLSKSRSRHELGYSGNWRQITGLAASASPTVRSDAGDSVKSSISHTYINEKRNDPLLPSSGYLLKAVSELAGFGGDVSFLKTEIETATAFPISLPGQHKNSGISMSGNFRAGLLYPLPLLGERDVRPSRINDRFILGGPTDIRGFKMGGLGPRDGSDGVGGDMFYAGSLNLLLPFPKLGADSPLRFQFFANGARLLALDNKRGLSENGRSSSKAVNESVANTIGELGRGLPSIAAGVGIVYAHPVARFELNFGVPIIMRRGEDARKGLQFGVGISFM